MKTAESVATDDFFRRTKFRDVMVGYILGCVVWSIVVILWASSLYCCRPNQSLQMYILSRLVANSVKVVQNVYLVCITELFKALPFAPKQQIYY